MLTARTALLALATLLGITGCGQPSGLSLASAAKQVARAAPGRQTAAPWDAPQNTTSFMTAAGLPALAIEGTAVVYRAHLDVIIGGRAVPVPLGIGIDFGADKISPVHTVDGTGVIWVEANTPGRFSLGQFFTEWDVRLDADCMGAYCSGPGQVLRAYVDGQPYPHDPAGLPITAGEEIALSFGPAGQTPTVPRSYDFPPAP
jgi:predicted small lipoprotein YifL